METTNYPQFLPLSVSSNYFTKWDCNIYNKVNLNVYYKCLEGYGQIDLASNCKYKGQIKNGMLEGKGAFYWPNGIVYQGDFVQSKITGQGTFRWPNGSYYQGQVYNGQREGQGTFFNAADNYTYIGSWKKGLKQGKGKMVYQDQSIYEGNFSKDKKNGFGKIIYASKNEYQGDWKDDRKCGKGTMSWLIAHQKYIGQWKQDSPHGYGQYFWYQNKTQYKIFKNMYKGYWKNGKREGFGAFFYSNGCRFEGYFFENLKQGSGIVIDQQGLAKIQVYINNRPVHLLSKTLNKFNDSFHAKDGQVKFPKLNSKKFTKQEVEKILSTKQTDQPLLIPQFSSCTHNEYKKYIDFNHPQINQTFYNMLLRHNSGLRNLYKAVGTSNSQYREFYSGMVLQNYWKLLRDCRLINQNLSLVSISREFSKGKRSVFELNLPNQKIIEILKKSKYDLELINYEQVLWYNFYEKVVTNCEMDWAKFKLSANKQQKIKLPSYSQVDIHQASNIILFRHFVCLIIHTAVLIDDSQKPMKDKVQSLINTLQHCNDNNFKAQKTQDNYTQISYAKAVTVPEWVKVVHEQFVTELEGNCRNFQNKIDVSVPVRKLYSVLEMCNIFKDVNEKILYLERIQRYLNIKNSPIKKQFRSYYPEIDKNIKSNPCFGYLMNYQMNFKQVNQFLFLCISRKFIAATQQQFQVKYSEVVRSLIKQVKQSKKNSNRPKLSLKCKKNQSWKDKAKKQLIIATQKKKLQQLELQKRKKQCQRQNLQRQLMQKQDHDAESITIESKDSYEYYQ